MSRTKHPTGCRCPWCETPGDPGADPLVEAAARAELLSARKSVKRALKLIDGNDLSKRRSKARLDILDACCSIDEAHLFLGGSEQGE